MTDALFFFYFIELQKTGDVLRSLFLKLPNVIFSIPIIGDLSHDQG